MALNAVTNTTEADIEDLFDEEFYKNLLHKAGIIESPTVALPPDSRIVKRVEAHIGKRYDHYRPARLLLEQQIDLLPGIDDNTRARFRELFGLVNGLL